MSKPTWVDRVISTIACGLAFALIALLLALPFVLFEVSL